MKNSFSLKLFSMVIVFTTSVFLQQLQAQSLQMDINLDDPLNKPLDSPQKGQSVGNEIRVLLQPVHEAVISSELVGRIIEIPLKTGEVFKKGSLLVRFSCKEQVAERRVASAKYSQADLEYKSNLELQRENAISDFEVLLSKAKRAEANASIAVAIARLAKCKIEAPFDGKVVKVYVNNYETVGHGEQIIEILSDSKLEMVLYMPSGISSKVIVGQEFSVLIDETKKQYKAKVTRISPRIDPTSKTLEITGEVIGETDGLRPGMSGLAFIGGN